MRNDLRQARKNDSNLITVTDDRHAMTFPSFPWTDGAAPTPECYRFIRQGRRNKFNPNLHPD